MKHWLPPGEHLQVIEDTKQRTANHYPIQLELEISSVLVPVLS
jgi:hypothetical protein